LQKEKSIKSLEGKILEKEQELQNLQEFSKKLSTNFVRNVRMRLQRLFPDLYKGKDGNQKLLRDVRFLKIACSGNIPKEMPNEKENLKALILQGKNKVCKDTGMPEETENFLLHERLQEEEEEAHLDRFEDSDTEEIVKESTVQLPVDKHPPPEENTLYSHARHTSIPAAIPANRPLLTANTYLNTPLVPTTGFIYPPTYPAQPNPHMENPWPMQHYQYQYNPQYQSTFANSIATYQPHSFPTNTTSTPYLHSTSTSATSTSESAAQAAAHQNLSQDDFTDVALQF